MMYKLRCVEDLVPDRSNPRKTDPQRLHLLRLSLSKLGFVLPIEATADGLVLSGHQRLIVSESLGWNEVPVDIVGIQGKDIKGINVLFNRVTNDFGALDTGSSALADLSLNKLIREAEKYPDIKQQDWPIHSCKDQSIQKLAEKVSDKYDKKAIVIAENFIRKGIKIPIVLSESGEVLNGAHRLFAARERNIETWPVIKVPDGLATLTVLFLNYLSMDFHVDEQFADMLRFCAYRRPQNNRGKVPKAYRFWANGERVLADKDSYSKEYWRNFRDLHGKVVLDFGAGLCKVAPYLNTKGIECDDFEPYRINPESTSKTPDPDYSRKKSHSFLEAVSSSKRVYDSIFLASVLNSVPFPRDRMAVLAIVHSLCHDGTVVYGTCRDISDFHYEYSGIRQANYFVFDSEPGVRLGDAIANPKIQKFMTQDEADMQFRLLWRDRKFWPGGNIFYWRLKHPKRVNSNVLRAALLFEFHYLPYKDGTIIGLGKEAVKAFNKRLGIDMPVPTDKELAESRGKYNVTGA